MLSLMESNILAIMMAKKHEKFIFPIEDNSAEAEKADESLIGFFIFAILAGLAAVFTPCVFPYDSSYSLIFYKEGKVKIINLKVTHYYTVFLLFLFS